MDFIEKLKKRQKATSSMLCVGLDPDPALIPRDIYLESDGVSKFTKKIIDATASFVCAFKFQIAFFSASEEENDLKWLIKHISTEYPDIPVILDAKRNDIGHVAEKYVQEAFDIYCADAVTVNPYFGQDSCQPFLDRKDKGIFIVCKTSNPGSKEFQDLQVFVQDPNVSVPGIGTYWPAWKHLAYRVAKFWNKNENCGLVIGATYPKELGEVRKMVGDMPILVPAIGEQGGDLKDVIENGLDSTGLGLIISSSRSIIYASSGPDFAEVAATEAEQLKDKINQLKESMR